MDRPAGNEQSDAAIYQDAWHTGNRPVVIAEDGGQARGADSIQDGAVVVLAGG